MSRPRTAVARSMRHAAAALLCAATSTSGWAQASDAALNQCRQETVAEKRLACYDAIRVPARAAAASTTGPATPAAAAPTAAATASRFGLPAAANESVDSRITGRFEGWGPRTRFTLANGQVWEVEDGTNASLWLDSPAVRVKRGFAGAFYLEIEGTNRSPRVRRLQ